MQQIYLDNNATTAVLPAVAAAMTEVYAAGYANPASQHQSGQRARRVLEEIRQQIADLLGAETAGIQTDRLIFTSGGTEANNLALQGLCGKPGSNIIISAIEHPSVVSVAEHLAERGYEVRRLPVDRTGVVLLDRLDDLIDQHTSLVSVMLGNHETGVLQPVRKIAENCSSAGVPMHTDAVQAVGKLPVNFRELGVAAMSFSAHKLHGPVGIGGLLLRSDVTPAPLLFGGFQQGAIRPGTEAPALARGMLTAMLLAHDEGEKRWQRMASLRDRLESTLHREIPEVVINGAGADRLPHTSSVSFPGLDRQAVVMALDLAGVACSTGSACASGSSDPSPVLLAMGLAPEVVEGSIRISLSALTTANEIDAVVSRIVRVYAGLRQPYRPRKVTTTPRNSTGKPI